VATALVALPALLAAILLGPPWLAVGVVALALAVGLREFSSLLRARGIRPMQRVGFALAAALFLDVVSPGWLVVPFAPLGALLLLTSTLWRGADFESVSAAAVTLLGAVYLGALGGTIAALRVLDPVGEGAWRMVLLLGILVFSDTFAFFVGHAVGRRRLLPVISPGKSVEGAIGGSSAASTGPSRSATSACPAFPPCTRPALGWRWRPWVSWGTSTRASSNAGPASRTRGRSFPATGNARPARRVAVRSAGPVLLLPVRALSAHHKSNRPSPPPVARQLEATRVPQPP